MIFNAFFRKNNVAKIYENAFNKKSLSAKQINQGFYGWVFLIENADNKKIIAKVYKQSGYMEHEVLQLDMMRRYALVRVPEIYSVSYEKHNGCFDVMFMEYIRGVNAAAVQITGEKDKALFSNQVVENLLAIHEASSADGFGSYTENEYSKSWESYYKSNITKLCHKVHNHKPLPFSKKSVEIMDILYESFDNIFDKPVKENHLIHGDYNLWNLMADPENNKLIGMIDPFGSCFADRELELFQLQNANGNAYKLLENYASYISLSDKFEIKNAYYSFWDDIKHMVNMGYCENKRFQECGKFVIDRL